MSRIEDILEVRVIGWDVGESPEQTCFRRAARGGARLRSAAAAMAALRPTRSFTPRHIASPSIRRMKFSDRFTVSRSGPRSGSPACARLAIASACSRSLPARPQKRTFVRSLGRLLLATSRHDLQLKMDTSNEQSVIDSGCAPSSRDIAVDHRGDALSSRLARERYGTRAYSEWSSAFRRRCA
jgi:hypothetical protein